MALLRRFTQSLVPFLILGSCANLIGLSDYDTGEASDDGGGGEGDTGGTAGTAQGGTGNVGDKPGIGGEEPGGQGGTIGGRISRGGTTSDGGMAGEPDGGQPGKGGTGATGGTTTTGGTGGMSGASGTGGAGTGGGGGTGGSPVCTEITLSEYIGAIIDGTQSPAVGAYDFEVDPELGGAFPDTFEIQFWDSGGTGDYNGALTGTFMLDLAGEDSNFAFCSRCLMLFQDEATSREKIFFQTDGLLNLATTSEHMTGFPNWTFDDITLREVTLDADQISTVVPGGECVHINTHVFSREAPTNWTCNIAWYSDADCDCGCGQLDPTCTSSSATACTYCWCNTASSCTPNEVIASQNWLCN